MMGRIAAAGWAACGYPVVLGGGYHGFRVLSSTRILSSIMSEERYASLK